ncbi:DUF6884 domain-containing protein [Isobaculum melis]|uniref:DUF6884 domain-containing protein n=1 Tax=Isobaculum melis TaxID=142588 RepID=A0A1H9PXY0_9LACT|nr:DUF6884 domain-containing protein [Isobaculum melis]SER53057.1 hypothetical protein SAMN04488559_101223 [Isobaculum melis]
MMIIPSGKPKIWDKQPDAGTMPANQAYTGTFHKLCQEYATLFDTDYLILSPFYGFLTPNTLIGTTYDVRFTQKGTTEQTISLTDLKKQWTALAFEEKEMVVLGGEKFKPLLEQIVPSTIQLTFPLLGLGGIGYMQQALKQAIHEKKPLHTKSSN